MIHNLVFDFGQVLVRFEPDIMISPYVTDPDDKRLLAGVLFDRLYWDRLDAGTITDGEVLAAVRSRLPLRLHGVAKEIYENWFRHLPEIDGMRTLIRRVRRQYGVRIFILSNISRGFAAHAEEIPILAEAEVCVFSAVCGHTKPNADIFAYLCGAACLVPDESLFIDDNAANIAGAGAFGFHTYRFDGDVEALSAYLDGVFATEKRDD